MDNLLTILSVLGLSGVIVVVLTYFFDKAGERRSTINEVKMKRYQAITVFMFTKLDHQNGMKHISMIRPDLKTIDDVEKEIEVEMLNSILYAHDNVIKSLGIFIKEPSTETYINTVNYMRKDLWKTKSEISADFFEFLK